MDPSHEIGVPSSPQEPGTGASDADGGLSEFSGASPNPPPAASMPSVRYDLRVQQALRRIIRAVDLHSRKLSAKFHITGPQLVCLLAVADHEPVTPSAIARAIYLSPSTVIGILDRLEGKGLIRRERDRKDRRLVHVTLKGQGRALVNNAPSPLQETLAEAMERLPDAEQASLADALDRVVELMEVRHIAAEPMLETQPTPTES